MKLKFDRVKQYSVEDGKREQSERPPTEIYEFYNKPSEHILVESDWICKCKRIEDNSS